MLNVSVSFLLLILLKCLRMHVQQYRKHKISSTHPRMPPHKICYCSPLIFHHSKSFKYSSDKTSFHSLIYIFLQV